MHKKLYISKNILNQALINGDFYYIIRFFCTLRKQKLNIFISDSELNKYRISINHLQNIISVYNIFL